MRAAAVTLDLWRTLIDEAPPPGTSGRRLRARIDGLADALALAGLRPPRARFESAMARSRESFDRDHDRGIDTTFEERVRQLIEFVEPGLSARLSPDVMGQAVRAIDAPFLDYPPVPVEGAGTVLERLGAMELDLALISNTGFTSAGTYRRWLSGLGWLRWLKVTTFSNEAAMAKPTEEIFRRTLAALGVAPANAIHIGDSRLHDVGGARRAGMRAVWLARGARDATADDGATPDFVIDDLAELPQVIERWMAGLGRPGAD